MENITSLKDDPLTLVAIIVGSVLMAVFIGHCFCQPSTGCSSLLMTNEKRPMVIRGKQWIKKTEFEICPHPSHKKHPCSNERDPNENQSASDPLPQISKHLEGMFGQIKEAAADLKDWAENRIKDLTKCPCDTVKENSPQLKDKLIQLNKAHLAKQKAQPERTDEINPAQTRDDDDLPSPGLFNEYEPTKVSSQSGKIPQSKALSEERMKRPRSGQLNEENPTQSKSKYGPLSAFGSEQTSNGQMNGDKVSKYGSKSEQVSSINNLSEERPKRKNCNKEIVLTAVVCVICSGVLMTGLILLADRYSGFIVQIFNQALQAIRDVRGN